MCNKPARETEKMSKIKVGDKFTDSAGCIVNVLAVSSTRLIYEHSGEENGWTILGFLKQFKPYQEPVPVKRIVAFVCDDGLVDFAIEGSKDCKAIEENANWKRIELSLEMFGFKNMEKN